MIGALAISLLIATSAAAAPCPAPVRPVTLDELRTQPRAYAGQTVRISGQVDQCWNYGCSLCPLEATPQRPEPERCLAIDFDRMRGPGGARGADMDAAFRYADVVVTARFDPACMLGTCLDRASVLLDARVEQVTRRRSSRDGLIARADPLIAAPAEVVGKVAELVRPTGSQPVIRPTAVFMTRSELKTGASATVCIWLGSPSTRAQWPTSWEGALVARSTEDQYRCWRAERDQHGWRLQPN